MNVLWQEIAKIDDSVARTDTSKEKIQGKVYLLNFMANHCAVLLSNQEMW